MFSSRRRRAASNPPLNGLNVNPNATTAAASAFLKNQASAASLSSAAAAAALRARPTTPTSVADVQTKRTIRRTASNASVGSSVSGSGRPTLERRASGSSMTERTFRDPSPSRPQGVPSAMDAPPVPLIPQHLQQSQQGANSKTHRRAASLEPVIPRVASPPLNKANGRGSSLGPIGMTQSPRRSGQRMSSLSSVQELTGAEGPASRGITAPNNQNLIYDPNTRSFLPAADLYAIEQRIQAAASSPRKKKRLPPATGTHLADGTVGGRPRGTAIDAMEEAARAPKAVEPVAVPVQLAAPVVAQEPSPASTAPKKKKKKKVSISGSESDQGSYSMSTSDNESDVSSQSATFNPRPIGALAKKPSIVREDREREEAEDDTPLRPKTGENLTLVTDSAIRQMSPSPLPGAMAGRGHGRGQASASASYAQGKQQTRSASQPAPESPVSANGAGLVVGDSARGGRVQSVSPARTTHFATNPDNLLVRHQPPPRSISPRKSALKHSHSISPRGPSPMELPDNSQYANESQGWNGSNVSDEMATPRKKANRVSFDDANVAIGQAALPGSTDSPVVPSPQTKRSWFSIGRGRRKEVTSIEDDEVMKPRPALPSFGSVREKKNRDVEERVLVKPNEHAEPKQTPTSPLYTAQNSEAIEFPLGQSNDHVVGAIISQDAASKNTANISKSREPLPPQVTSVEGTGYVSDSDTSSYSLDNDKTDLNVAQAESGQRVPDAENTEVYATTEYLSTENMSRVMEDNDRTPAEKSNPLDPHTPEKPTIDIPKISILSATPTTDHLNAGGEWPSMPGSWDNSNSDSENQNLDQNPHPIVKHRVIDPSPADAGIAEPSPEKSPPGSPALGDIATHNAHTTPAILEETEESDASIYSDAAEDLSDLEGDGFMSLDAVVESPVSKPVVPELAITTPPESPTTKAAKERAYRKSGLARSNSGPDAAAGWDKAQAYWSGLTAEKKRQLEAEARAEAEADSESSETEVEVKPVPQPKKKKKKVVSQPIQPPVQRVASPPVNNERTYMIQPGSKAVPNEHAPLKSSLRKQPQSTAGDTHIRQSMRSPGAGSMRGSMRGHQENSVQNHASLQKKHRPMSYPPNEVRANPDQVRQHIQALSVASAAAAQRQRDDPSPTLRRRGSADSDSSFKRARPTSQVPSFRRSMRMSVDETGGRQQSPMRSSRFSLRSLSPTGSTMRRPFSNSSNVPPVSLSQTHMRGSMRNSTDSTKGGLFGRPSSRGGKQRISKSTSSRFADSSDEDEQPISTFRSRFVDSSDDDEPSPPKARGMARTMRNSAPVPKRTIPDGDSSDLPDSSDENPAKSNLKPNKILGINGNTATTSNQGNTLASGSLRRSGSGRGTISIPPVSMTNGTATPRPNQSRRGSFMSILRRKKPDPTHKIRKSDAESPARRDTPLERSKSDLSALKYDSGRPSTPRLQKRNTASRQNSGTWPLPASGLGLQDVAVDGGDGRPFTSDGTVVGEGSSEAVNGVSKPELGTRRLTADGANILGSGAGGVVGEFGSPRKKKKFGALRRMFRLDD